jgi:hypothetical protein
MTQDEVDKLNDRLLLIAERLERKKAAEMSRGLSFTDRKAWSDRLVEEYDHSLTAILSQLRNEPRDE